MFPPVFRLTIVIALFAYAAIGLEAGNKQLAFVSIVAAGIFAAGHFMYGTVWLAWRALKRGETEKARGLIRRTRSPRWLTSQMRAYYYWVHAELAQHDGKLEEAYGYLEKAGGEHLRSVNDKAVVECGLAELDIELGRPERARERLEKIKGVDYGPQVEQVIQNLEAKLDSLQD